MKKRLLVIMLLILALTLGLASCGDGEKKVTALTVIDGSVSLEYTVGDTPDFSGIKAVISYSDGSAETVEADKLTVGTIDTSSAGKKELSVKYGDFETKLEITVKEAPAPVVLESISIIGGTVNTELYIGDILDTSRLQAEALYSDGSKKYVAASGLTIGQIDTSTVGDKTLTVSYTDGEITKSTEVTVKVSGIASITVVEGTLGKLFNVGDTIDTSALEVIVNYQNGKSETLGASKLTVTAPSTEEMGEKSVLISYRGAEVSYKVMVRGVTEITVNPGSVKTEVKVGTALDVTGVSAKATYNNGDEMPLTNSQLSIQNIDTSTVGTKQLIVKYGNVETSVSVKVYGVKSMILTGLASEILVGGSYSTTGAVATVTLDNAQGTSETVYASDLTFGELDTATAGEKKLDVTYLGFTYKHTVKVCGPVALKVTGVPNQINAGETPDLSLMKVFLVYSDTDATEIEVTEGYATNYDDLDFDVEGIKTLTVSYEGFSTNVIIDTEPPVLESIVISKYAQLIGLGQVYNTSGITAIAKYGNESTKEIASSGLTVSEISTDTAGEVTLTVSYTEDGITKEATATVKVLPIKEIVPSGLDTLVNIGEEYNTENLKVTVIYGEGELSSIVGIEDGVTVSGYDTAVAGDQTVTVSYLGASATVSIHVKAVASISILAGSVSSEVRFGYAIDTAGIIINVVYSNGDTAQFTKAQLGDSLTVSAPDTTSGASSVTLTVSYEGKSASMNVSVLTIDRIHAVNGTIPSSVLKDSVIDYDSLRITVIYKDANNNFFTYLVGKSDPNLKITEISTATTGDKAIVFEFVGFSTSANITVKGVTKIELVDGIQQSLNVGQTLVTSDIKVKVEFSDGTYIYATTMDLNLEVDASGVDTSTAGDKVLKVYYLGFERDIVIKVYDVNVGDGMIFGIALPDSLVERESYKLNFKLQDSPYVVGDDNLYYFYLNAIQLDNNDNLIELDGRNIESLVKVYLVDGSETLLEGDALTQYVTVDAAKNSYDFTEAAIGKTFRLEIKPKENYLGTDSRSHTVKIVDGYNVYSAKELHIMTNVDHDLDGGDIGTFNSSMTAINNFLQANGIVRPAKLAGLVIHQNLDITMDDVPSEFFHTYTKNGVTKTELLDRNHIFNREADNENAHFAIHGNYYSIYSYKIPCVVEKGVMNNIDEFSNSTLFKFDVKMDLWNESFNHENYSTTVENLSFRDNDPNSNDQAASERHMRGVLCMRYSHQVFNIKNTNVEAYYVSTSVDYDNLTVNFDSCKLYNAWQGHIFIWNDNQIQRHLDKDNDAPLAFHKNIKVNITNSLVAKCGGPVILSQNDYSDYKCNDNSGVEVVADYKSEIYSYVTGQEAWFVAVNHTATASNIKSLDTSIQTTSKALGTPAQYTTTDKIEGVSTINFMFMVMGTGTELGGTEKYKGSFTRINEDGSRTVGLNMSDPYVNIYVDNVQAATGAPVFQSSSGAVFCSDGNLSCFSVDLATQQPGLPMQGSFTGDYLTLYYLGMGVMLEYFN